MTPVALAEPEPAAAPWARGDNLNSNEMIALDVLDEMLRLYPSAFSALKEYSWLSDTISADELDGILGLLVIVDRFPPGDPSLLQALSETPW